MSTKSSSDTSPDPELTLAQVLAEPWIGEAMRALDSPKFAVDSSNLDELNRIAQEYRKDAVDNRKRFNACEKAGDSAALVVHYERVLGDQDRILAVKVELLPLKRALAKLLNECKSKLLRYPAVKSLKVEERKIFFQEALAPLDDRLGALEDIVDAAALVSGHLTSVYYAVREVKEIIFHQTGGRSDGKRY